MGAPALEELRSRAGAGEVEAMTRLGARLLMSREAASDPEEGADLVARAAEAGGAEAAHLAAVLAGAGVFRPQSWPEALDLLQRSAERGLRLARDQLALLAGAGELDPQAALGRTL